MSEVAKCGLGGGNSGLKLISTFSTGAVAIDKSGNFISEIIKYGSSWFTPNLSNLREVMLEISTSFSGTLKGLSNQAGGIILDLTLGSGIIKLLNGSANYNEVVPLSKNYEATRFSLPPIFNGQESSEFYMPVGASGNPLMLNVEKMDSAVGNICLYMRNGDNRGEVHATGSVTIKVWGRELRP